MNRFSGIVRSLGTNRLLAVGAGVCAVTFGIAYAAWPTHGAGSDGGLHSPGNPTPGPSLDNWSSAGSAAFVDESDADLVAFTGPAVSILTSAPASSNLLLRYNVTTNANLSRDDLRPFLQARFRDNGNAARVITRLRQVHMGTGVNTLLLTVDSNDFSPSGIYQIQYTDAKAGTLPFDFNEHFYFVEVTIYRDSAAGLPGLLGIMVGRY